MNHQEFDRMMENNRLYEIAKLREEYFHNQYGLYKKIKDAECLKPQQKDIKTIGLYCHRLFSGGSSRIASFQMQSLVESGYQVVLFVETVNEELEYPIPEGVIRYQLPVDRHPDMAPYLERINILDKALDDHHIDLFLYNVTVTNDAFFDSLVIKSRGIPILGVFHLILAWYLMKGKPQAESRFALAGLFDTLAVQSRMEQDLYQSIGANVVFIPNPIDPSMKLKTPAKGNDIIWVGRMTENEKNPSEAIRIIAKVKETIPDVKLRFHGIVSDKTKLQLTSLMEELAVEDNIEFCGFTQSLDDIYDNAAIQLVTSTNESFSMVVIEGKCYGVPLVMYELPYLEITQDKDAYFGVPWGDVDSAADAIIRLLTDDNLYSDYSSKAQQSIIPFMNFSLTDALQKEISHIFDEKNNAPNNMGMILETMLFNYDKGISQLRASHEQEKSKLKAEVLKQKRIINKQKETIDTLKEKNQKRKEKIDRLTNKTNEQKELIRSLKAENKQLKMSLSNRIVRKLKHYMHKN